MNFRSIRFRLTAWYAGLLLIVAVVFGAYTYTRLEAFLTEALVQILSSRAYKIAEPLVSHIPQTGENYVVSEVKARYSPEMNDRFIRITRGDSSILYVSGVPYNGSFDPAEVPLHKTPILERKTLRVTTQSGAKLLVTAYPVTTGGKHYLVEVGASEAGIDDVLARFITTLAIGLPMLVGVAIVGGYLLVKWALVPVQNIVGAAQEITLHHLDKRLPLVKTGDEIEKLSAALNQMISRLDRAFQMASRFTSDASHELRTPLTIIRGELETLLLDRNLPDDIAELLGSILEETERLSKIVEGLLALSRLDTGEAQLERVKVDLSELAATTADQMCLLAEEKGIRLSCDTTTRVKVEGDPAKLKQVLVNLLDNAIKYTPAQGAIHLSVATRDGSAFLNVSDTGPGIPEAALSRVFDRFYRADEVRSREVEGTGLGLSIVRSVCAAHGGTITVENQKSGGCCFTVQLPLAGRI